VVQDKVSQALVGALRSAQQRGVLKLEQMPMVNLEAPKRPEWGDVSCTVAMSLSASERRPPFEIKLLSITSSSATHCSAVQKSRDRAF
jgi:arginyl-tRNA synthetase